jgi:hypothetical protein
MIPAHTGVFFSLVVAISIPDILLRSKLAGVNLLDKISL